MVREIEILLKGVWIDWLKLGELGSVVLEMRLG